MQGRLSLAMLKVAHVAIVTSSVAQTYPVKKCDAPKEPLGVLHAQGQVTYRLNFDGKVDTATLRVVSLRGISAAGLRSAAVRQLSGCRFDRTIDTVKGPVIVVDALGFDSATLVVSPATVVPSTIATIDVPEHPKVPTDPMDAADSTIEERPRRIGCDQVADIPPFTGLYRTRQDRDAAFAAWQRQNSGVVLAKVTVDADGRVQPNGIIITSSTNPPMNSLFVSVLASCRYVPARISGVPVATIVATRTGIGGPTGPP